MSVYPFGPPGHGVVIHDGDIEVVGVGAGAGTVRTTMNGDLNVEWEVDLPHGLNLGPVTLRLARPDLGTVEVDAVATDGNGCGYIPGGDLTVGRDMTHVTVHWVNLPWIQPAEPLCNEWGSWPGRWTSAGAGWIMKLDSRQNIGRTLSSMKGGTAFAVTHVGDLRRVDESTFTAKSAADALYGWQIALSFALGRWVAPALPVGFDINGKRVWEQWASWRCDATTGYQGWWDSHNGEDLKDYVGLFLGAWADPKRHDVIRHMSHHVIAANHGSTTVEARIMLAQAALEYLSWVTYVVSGNRSRRAYGRDNAADHLRELLATAAIPSDTPIDLSGLRQFASQEGLTDGPQVVTRVRNLLTHPKDAGQPYRIHHLVTEAWLLCMQYAELLLLHELNYRGEFIPRFPPGRWAHAREPVPWR